MPALEASHITHRYGEGPTSVTALDDVSLSVEPGEVLAVLGPSGSGKTTLLSIAGGLLTPSQGSVTIAGVSLAGTRRRALTDLRARHVGFVFQTHNLVPYLTSRENLVVIGALLAGNPGPEILDRRARELLETLGLTDRHDHLPSELSVGESQRVAIARALLNEPSLLLVDEPTANLDTNQGEEVVELLVDQARSREVAVVMVTHDEHMAAHADRDLHLRDGKMQSPSSPAPDR